MFNIGPMELVVLAIVGLIVLGPDKLPGLAKDAARMIRTLRELAQGARTQLRDELGPEFADMDLRSLNPRTAIQRAILGDDADVRAANPRSILRDVMSDDEPAAGGEPVRMVKPVSAPMPRPSTNGATPFDADAT